MVSYDKGLTPFGLLRMLPLVAPKLKCIREVLRLFGKGVGENGMFIAIRLFANSQGLIAWDDRADSIARKYLRTMYFCLYEGMRKCYMLVGSDRSLPLSS